MLEPLLVVCVRLLTRAMHVYRECRNALLQWRRNEQLKPRRRVRVHGSIISWVVKLLILNGHYSILQVAEALISCQEETCSSSTPHCSSMMTMQNR